MAKKSTARPPKTSRSEISYRDLEHLQIKRLPPDHHVDVTEIPLEGNLSVGVWINSYSRLSSVRLTAIVGYIEDLEEHPGSDIDAVRAKIAIIRAALRPLVRRRVIVDEGESVTDGEEWVHASLSYSRELLQRPRINVADVIRQIVESLQAVQGSLTLRVFLCHASEDKDFVDRLEAFLKRRRIAYWYDKREIKPGESIVERVSNGIEQASHVVVVLSPFSVTKAWVRRELSASLMRHLSGSATTVLPVLRGNCQIPAILADIKYADCRTNERRGFVDLLSALRGNVKSYTEPPPKPR